MNRRDFPWVLAAGWRTAFAAAGEWTPQALTRGPKFHWFGYYDHLEFDPTDRYVLGMEADFEDRLPGLNDRVALGMIDLKDNNRWLPLAESKSFSWQQGCMLQWLPGSDSSVIYNDREGDQFVAHILDVKTGKRRTVPSSIQSVSHDGRWAVTTDFRRLRPETRYAIPPHANDDVLVPPDSGIWRVDLETGTRRLLFSIGDLSRIPDPLGSWEPVHWHWLHHLLLSPDDSRFAFVHRWGYKGSSRIIGTRFCTADPDGGNLYIYPHLRFASHFIWRDPKHLLIWATGPSQQERFHLCEDRSERAVIVGQDDITANSHVSYLPQKGSRWLLNDSYPDKQRTQSLYLYNVEARKRVELGRFHSPPRYTGPLRCDLHPRTSRDGRKIVFDSPHAGNGRQMYLIDIGSLPA
ncbi:MAG: hypothetical protein AAB225_05665 [Acidobacteriota bacterium]